MKIRTARSNAHRRAFLVETARGTFEFPWAQSEVVPSPADPVVTIDPDPELGKEAFSYRLRSGAEGTVHLDHVLHFVREPGYQREQLVYELTCRAMDALADSGRSKRSLARQLGTSLAQVSRLFDSSNTQKSLDQMVRLLAALGRRVDLHVAPLE